MKVSVVVPVYNPGRHLEPCIRSLLRQSLPPDEMELIFVDDGSTDETPDRLDRLAKDHAHVTVIHQENSGWPGKPRNVGTDAARGVYVIYVDQDDELAEEALERMHAYGSRHGADVVVGKMVGIGRGVPSVLFQRNRPRATIHDSPLIDSLTPHKMFRRSFLLENGIRFPEGRRRLEDHVFVVACYFAARNVSVLADYPCYVHIRRDDSGNAGFRPFDPAGYYGNLCEALDVVEENTDPGARRDRLYRRWLRVEMVGRLRSHRLLRWDDDFQRELFDEIRKVVVTRFPLSVDAGLPPVPRHVACLVRRDDFAAVRRFAEWERRLTAEATLGDAAWRDGRLWLTVEARLVDGDGATATSARLLAPDLDTGACQERDVTLVDRKSVALRLLRRGATSTKDLVLAAEEVTVSPAGTVIVRAAVDISTGCPGDGTWDVQLRLPVSGRPLLASVERPAGWRAKGDPREVAVLHVRSRGAVQLQVGDRAAQGLTGRMRRFVRRRARWLRGARRPPH